MRTARAAERGYNFNQHRVGRIMNIRNAANRSRPRRAVLSSLTIGGALLLGAAIAVAEPVEADYPSEQGCGDVFHNAFGPFDYTDPVDLANLPIVDDNHFTPVVERLERGISSTNVLDDIAYTLRAFPNHHRALNAIARYEVEKGGIPPGSDRWMSAQCWFDRALRFRPRDGTVWLIYGNLKARQNRNDEALEAYEQAQALLPGSAEVAYNLGLLYMKTGEHEKALAQARKAYASDYPLQGLRRKLAEKGYNVSE